MAGGRTAPADAAAASAPAPAKINLYLHVVGRRADGFHLLDSLVAFAGVGDLVAARPADALTLALDGPFAADLAAAPGGDNLVLRAARALAAAAAIAPRAAIALTKSLPVASGIGGGSADAAAALRALVRLWGVTIDDAALARVAASLGADVPVCLAGRTSFMGGIGEEIAPAPALPPAGLVLVNPRIALPTPAVFKRREGPFSPPARFAAAPRDASELAALLAGRGNDLTAPARAIVPAIDDVLAALAASPGCLLARLSGSGATCFGLYADPDAAHAAAAWIAARHAAWWIAGTRIG
ncbi:MAG: 4-(cytidine 5'-diphospho)-2-C-methyl-D-erythritol kinase [Alphaproteobacteria bacterium]|nr:4-(cytidine 5'-diphospho)-2-C-methyl-D-erythritol kinase [Alphaproteobacteria bacterium]